MYLPLDYSHPFSFVLSRPRLGPFVPSLDIYTVEKTEINTTEKLKLLEQQYDAAKSIILSDAHDEYENKQPFEFPKESSELESKPNRTFTLYPNVILKQRDTALKSSDAKQIHNTSYPNATKKQRDTVLKSSNPKETNNPSSPNVIEKQKDTVLKPSSAKEIHSPTFDFPKQKTKLTSKHFENPIPKIYLNENPTKNDPSKKVNFKNNRR